jgi:ribonuclease VapC
VSSVVLDASALLALVFNEAGADEVAHHIPGSRISAVNLAEVVAKAAQRDMTIEAVNAGLRPLPIEVADFDQDAAYLTASLRPRTFGLSLGDRACLAPGLKLGVPVLTADRKWLQAELDIKIVAIR